MNSTWNRIKSKINNVFNPKKEEEKDYLTKLADNLKEAQKNHQSLSFRINSAKRNGFVVKVKGLFAYVSFHHMPWEYKSIEYWRAVSKHLVGTKFFCKVHSISENVRPIQIIVNAENHIFEKTKLIPLEQYDCVVMQKSKYGLIVDLGYHFDWEYGSFSGLIHKSTYPNDDKLLNAELGDIVNTYFHGIKKKGSLKNNGLILGNQNVQKEWLTGEFENIIGTNQTATIMLDDKGKRAFFIDGKYRTMIFIDKKIYPNKKAIKKELNNLKIYSNIECRVLRISKSNNFVAEPLNI
jgi:ribosomal protein S1